jgi:hypothetical protein
MTVLVKASSSLPKPEPEPTEIKGEPSTTGALEHGNIRNNSH